MSAQRAARADRSETTRETLLLAAERLFAEHGMHAVSNRQISEAAGQGNNAAACYHFGTRTDLLRAIEAKHRVSIDALRVRALEDIEGSDDLRDWVSVLVRPLTDQVTVQSAQIVTFDIDAQLVLYPGPDQQLVLATANAALDQLIASSRHLGRDITRSAIGAALHVAGVQNVVIGSPAADVVVDLTQAANLGARSVAVSGVAT